MYPPKNVLKIFLKYAREVRPPIPNGTLQSFLSIHGGMVSGFPLGHQNLWTLNSFI